MTTQCMHLDREGGLLLEKSLSREWFEFDGRGGYASSSAVLCPTRRYHGLLVTAPDGHVKRHVFLSRFEESLHGHGKSFATSLARYPGAWSPHGFQSFESFKLDPYPSFEYRIGRVTLRREIQMLHSSRTVLSRYQIEGGDEGIELRLRPLLAYREADALTFENIDLDPRVRRKPSGIELRPYPALPPFFMDWEGTSARFDADPVWYRQIEYVRDLERGYDGHEDQFSPGILRVPLSASTEIVIAASIDASDPQVLDQWEARARERETDRGAKSVRETLALHAPDYLYRTQEGRLGVIAGFPWFGEWGRDTYLSLPGLTLARGDRSACKEALLGARDFLSNGLLPNIFGKSIEDSHYGSVDAALWYVRAIRLYEKAGADRSEILSEFLPAILQIVRNYRDGTSLGIVCDPNGLIRAGSPELNATWMDARTHEGPVTPRDGYAVEINALWYFALAYLESLLDSQGDQVALREWQKLRRRAGRSFLESFWLKEESYLADCCKDGQPDPSVRPNQVIAAALEFSPLSRSQRADVVQCAKALLLTPRGLRTLSPKHPSYHGSYGGDTMQRDEAYHQGTVWPWLLGFFVEAALRGKHPSKKRCAWLRDCLEGFEEHLGHAGQGHVSEVFDGDPPHKPGGTPAQAWSVAELLRAYALLDEAEG